ncbi:MAG: 4-(cytidine 5'-diphospho)-2-C-methyl-D-erythritol kinase [Dethiobacteria bacterium]|jgi:4-diphosphocytidyl-2-C-methyl-D-erythritol kinase
MRLKLKSYAKINIVLEILARRSDGFHEVETVLQQLKLHDTIYLEELPCGKVEFFCDDASLPAKGENLAFKAAQLFKTIVPNKGAKITLHKKIPIAAGLGGGSSNAAMVLLGLNELWGAPLDEASLFQLGAKLGSDVPFFFWGGTALAKGRGEVVYSLPALPTANVLLVIPQGLQLTAKEIYNSLNLSKITRKNLVNCLIRHLKKGPGDCRFLADFLHNDLETSVFSLAQSVFNLKQKLKQKKLPALVSGSGPTIFILSPDEEELLDVGKELRKEGYKTILTATEQAGKHIMLEEKEGGDV